MWLAHGVLKLPNTTASSVFSRLALWCSPAANPLPSATATSVFGHLALWHILGCKPFAHNLSHLSLTLPPPLLLIICFAYMIHSIKWCHGSLPMVSFSISLAAFKGAPRKGRIVSEVDNLLSSPLRVISPHLGHAWFAKDDWEPLLTQPRLSLLSVSGAKSLR